jgi:5-methylthioadenosine/S-adenosylhomocysteine deaminase
MEQMDQIIHAKWIITGEKTNTPLENHAIIIQNGIIKNIIESDKVNQLYSAKSTTHCASHVLLPGLINSHTHLAMNYFRGLADDLTLMNWLTQHIWPAEQKWVDSEFVRDASLFAMAEMIRSGTTCFNDMYFFLQATAEAADVSGLRAFIGMTVIDVPTAWAKTSEEYIAKGLEFFHQYKNHALITSTLAPHAPYTVGDETLLQIKKIADEHHLKINMHIHETADEVKQSLEKYQMRPLQRLHKLGLVSPQLIAIHMTQINDEDMTILSETKPQIVHCPESNMKLASGTCPVTRLQAHGLNVALGTDGAASNNDLDMLGEMRTAAFLAKHSTHNPTSLSAAEAISLATINGARALGIEKLVGTLEIGKAADFIAITLDEIETLPLYHPTSQLIYAAGRDQVTDVWVNGKQLLKNRQLLTLDEGALKDKARYWQQKIKG